MKKPHRFFFWLQSTKNRGKILLPPAFGYIICMLVFIYGKHAKSSEELLATFLIIWCVFIVFVMGAAFTLFAADYQITEYNIQKRMDEIAKDFRENCNKFK